MTIIKEYVKCFALIGPKGENLGYRQNQCDAEELATEYYEQYRLVVKIQERSDKKFILRTDTYAHSLGYFKMLFDEAKKYFPLLKVDDVEVVKYAGCRYARTMGIEFSSNADAPSDFNLIDEVELTY